jgi:DNA-binding transcriptional LysR family regulator
VLAVEDQPLVLVSPAPEAGYPGEVVARSDLAGLRLIVFKQGSLMRQLVDVLASGVEAQIVVEVEHRTFILPMVLGGIGHAVMPSSWTPLAERAGAVVRRIEPTSLLRIVLVTRKTPLPRRPGCSYGSPPPTSLITPRRTRSDTPRAGPPPRLSGHPPLPLPLYR